MTSSRRLTLALATLAAPLASQTSPYRTIDLGPVPGAGSIAGVIAEDVSRDATFITGGSWDPYVWSRNTGMRRLALPAGQFAGLAATVNENGFVGGYAGLSAAPYYRALLWDPAGSITQLHQTGWVWSLVKSINDRNEMLLSISLPNGTSIGESHAFLRSPTGALLDLTAGRTSGSAIDLNEAGQALYASSAGTELRDPSGRVTPVPSSFSPWHLSEAGEVVGTSTAGIGVWTDGAGWRTLPSGPLRLTRPGGLNSFGQVGASHSVQTSQSPPSYAYFGHLYTEGLGWVDLIDLTDRSEVTRIYQVKGITDSGALAADAAIGPDNRAVLIEPRHSTVFGQGCATGMGTTPRAIVAGNTRAGGRIALLGAGAAARGTVVHLIAAGRANTPLPGNCTLLLDPTSLVAVTSTANAAGQASLAADLPASSTGRSLWFQLGVLDASAPNGAFALSNGVRVDVP